MTSTMDNEVLTYLYTFPTNKQSEKLCKLIFDYMVLIKEMPASTKYHSSCIGGWLKHTFEVHRLCTELSVMANLTDDESCSLLFCALLHDFGKLGKPEAPGYLSKINNKQEIEIVNNPLYLIPHELRTIQILHKYNIPLTDDEFTAIVYHAGLYTNDKEIFCKIENKMVLLLHTADNLAAKLFEEIEADYKIVYEKEIDRTGLSRKEIFFGGVPKKIIVVEIDHVSKYMVFSNYLIVKQIK